MGLFKRGIAGFGGLSAGVPLPEASVGAGLCPGPSAGSEVLPKHGGSPETRGLIGAAGGVIVNRTEWNAEGICMDRIGSQEPVPWKASGCR